ncbi:MAG: pirin family protein [Microthrixaceae bacterium]|nr:pirin family protein [Microthrixaceae bacterium]
MSPVLDIEPLKRPWQALDPFLVVAHHDDRYPRATGTLGPDSDLAGRTPGNDFASIGGWNMYFGQSVPGFPRHPHRGFETITYARTGWVDHSDSLGARGRYGHGDVQWMTAGRGINHAEMFPLLDEQADNPLDLFQIWINLPARSKFVDPGYLMLWSDEIPAVDHGNGTTVTVIAGDYEGHAPPRPPGDSWAGDPQHDVTILHLEIGPDGTVQLPYQQPTSNRVLYLFGEGDVAINGELVAAGSAVTLDPAAPTHLAATGTATAAFLLNGEPIGEPVVARGPFVMNTEAEIDEAFADYRSTRFGTWPWNDDAPTQGTNPRSFSELVDLAEDRPGVPAASPTPATTQEPSS